MHQAKTNLSKLIQQAEAGEEVVIARGDKPAVKLVLVPKKYPKRKPGADNGQFTAPNSFFDDLPEASLPPGGRRSPPILFRSRNGPPR